MADEIYEHIHSSQSTLGFINNVGLLCFVCTGLAKISTWMWVLINQFTKLWCWLTYKWAWSLEMQWVSDNKATKFMGWHELFVLTWRIADKDIGWKYLKDYDNKFLYTCEFKRQEGGALKEGDPIHPPQYTHVACTPLIIYPTYTPMYTYIYET